MDLYHAREHLHDLARSLEFMLGDGKDEWLGSARASCRPGASGEERTVSRRALYNAFRAHDAERAESA